MGWKRSDICHICVEIFPLTVQDAQALAFLEIVKTHVEKEVPEAQSSLDS